MFILIYQGISLIENVTCVLPETDKSVELAILVFTVLSSFIIAYFTVVFTEIYREKKDYETLVAWFKIDLVNLDYQLSSLKTSLENEIMKLKKNPSVVSFYALDFPSITFIPYNQFIARGYWRLLSPDENNRVNAVKTLIEELVILESRFNQTRDVMCSRRENIDPQEYTASILKTLNMMIDRIENLSKIKKELNFPPYPSLMKMIRRK